MSTFSGVDERILVGEFSCSKLSFGNTVFLSDLPEFLEEIVRHSQ